MFDVSQPASVGVTSIIQNIGKVTNSGVEIELDYNAFKNKDWSVSVGANATFVKNKIKNLPATMKENGYISGSKKWLEGKSIYEFWLRQWHGVDPQTGDGLYVADVSKYNQDVYKRQVYIRRRSLPTMKRNLYSGDFFSCSL